MRHLDKEPKGCLEEEIGFKRAQNLGDALKNLAPKSRRWTILYSDECRTRDTASAIAAILGVTPRKDDNLLPHTDLRDGWFLSYARGVARNAAAGENHLLVTHSQKLDVLNKELNVLLPTVSWSDKNYGVAYVISGTDASKPLLGCIWPDDWSVLKPPVGESLGK